jgi:hypothetical protein
MNHRERNQCNATPNETNAMQRHFAPQSALRQSPGELMFVPAGVVDRFEAFSDAFTTWVIFSGFEGGA